MHPLKRCHEEDPIFFGSFYAATASSPTSYDSTDTVSKYVR